MRIGAGRRDAPRYGLGKIRLLGSKHVVEIRLTLIGCAKDKVIIRPVIEPGGCI